LGIYLAVKIADLTIRDAWPYVWEGSIQSSLFIVELTFGVIAPAVFLSLPKVRKTVAGLFTSASLVIGGVALNRIDVFLVAYTPLYPTKTYFPSLFEIMVTVGLISALVLVYRFIVLNFPVISSQGHHGDDRPVARVEPNISIRKVN
jgi:Ni/Fe-hydrogenase subunit HybB-like protein